jgi:hypothetical protein
MKDTARERVTVVEVLEALHAIYQGACSGPCPVQDLIPGVRVRKWIFAPLRDLGVTHGRNTCIWPGEAPTMALARQVLDTHLANHRASCQRTKAAKRVAREARQRQAASAAADQAKPPVQVPLPDLAHLDAGPVDAHIQGMLAEFSKILVDHGKAVGAHSIKEQSRLASVDKHLQGIDGRLERMDRIVTGLAREFGLQV